MAFGFRAVAAKKKSRAAAATGGHGGGVEDGGCITAIEDLVEALDDGFEEAVDTVRARELKERAEDLGAAEGVRWGGEGRGV